VQNANVKLGELFKVIGSVIWLQEAIHTKRVFSQGLKKEPNGHVTTNDLRKSLEQSSVEVSETTLDDFFSKVDSSHQGSISYEEWRSAYPCICIAILLIVIERDFLQFSPTKLTNLEDAFAFYSRTLKSNHDGDVYISEETIKHLGTVHYLVQLLSQTFVPPSNGNHCARSVVAIPAGPLRSC
jgi:hypothetical protein